MLEDDFTYVIRKAFKGLGLAPGEAALRASLPEKEVLAFSRGHFSAEIARKLAPVLGLNPAALAAHHDYLPEPLKVPEIHRLDLPFGRERVNAWLIRTYDEAVLLDTGYDSQSCAAALAVLDAPPLGGIFITHSHPDHVGGMKSFPVIGHAPYGSRIENAMAMHPGDSIPCGTITIRACDLSGHCTPALGFHIDGLAAPVLVTGDALFAGSIGGCQTPALYQHALHRLREILSPLPDSTVLLPGHGPATTLGEERASNPFL